MQQSHEVFFIDRAVAVLRGGLLDLGLGRGAGLGRDAGLGLFSGLFHSFGHREELPRILDTW